jgi:trans-2,3-dihydro-3-hydroxyanthranilate isomerase
MNGHRFFYVDVFAQRPLTGNPVVVVADAEDLDEPTMGAIAREFNQSETAFVLPADAADWRLRSFTPIGAEVFGAGHNALGAWLWLAASGRLPAQQSAFVQQIGAELLPVEVNRRPDGTTAITMEHSPPVFGAHLSDRPALAEALRIGPADLSPSAPQVVSTGAGHLLVEVSTRAAVDRCSPEASRLAPLLAEVGGEGCYVYSREPGDPAAAAYARFFNPVMGIGEDPATGTAAGPLAARLVAEGIVADGAEVIVEQGHAMGRPSRIEVTVTGSRVRLSGTGLVVADGTLHT